MLRYFRWNDGTVILYLNQHLFRFVAINQNVDLSVRLITDCLNRIFQKINDYLRGITKTADAQTTAATAAIHDAVTTYNNPKTTVVYRGVSAKGLQI